MIKHRERDHFKVSKDFNNMHCLICRWTNYLCGNNWCNQKQKSIDENSLSCDIFEERQHAKQLELFEVDKP